MELFEGIYTRRSVRQFAAQPVEREQLLEIIRAGTWAPSGMNNQPWRFVIVQSKAVRSDLAKLTKYHFVIAGAPACIQNMLLAAHALGLGAVWLGEILKNAADVRTLLGLPADLDLMAVVALGHPAAKSPAATRKAVADVLLKEL